MVDRFKTQVMFLHPEPALMEPCASRLGDEFSVHMAASGTEALTTLGITPIDIIVSAQDLPGMTGQEALKEAKKRSPDTRSILVASQHMTDADRAALVNVRHLNQVLRAESSPEEICAAIHATLRGEKVSSFAIPANDSSPGLNSQSTGATGSFAVDMDATGSFQDLSDIPVIEPGNNVDVTAHAISHVEIVVLTNDASFLKTIRAAAGTSHVVNHAPNLQEAIDIAREGAAGVLITDAAVAVKDVKTITAQLRKHIPSLVTIVAGRREDGEKMMGLISDGLVYRFLLKPVSPGRSRLAIEASAKKHLTLNATDVPLSPTEVQEKMTETGIIKGVTFDSGLFRTTDVRQTGIDAPELDDELEPSLLSGLRNVPPIVWAIGGIAAIGAAVLLSGGSDEPAESTPAQPVAQIEAPTSEPEPAPVKDPVVAASESLAAGDAARREGKLVLPADDNAVLHYATAARLQRSDPLPRARLDAVLEDVFTQVEREFLADNLDQVSDVLAVLNTHVPSHPRLAFLNRELGKELSRREFSEIERDLINGDLNAAERRLQALERSGNVDTALIESTRARLDELRTAREAASISATSEVPPTPRAAPVEAPRSASTDRPETAPTTSASAPQTASVAEPTRPDVSGLIERANLRLSEGNLVTPAGDSARDYFAAALAQDPDNALAEQGLTFVASGLVSRATDAVAQGDANLASQLIAQAEVAGADANTVRELRASLSEQQTPPPSASTVVDTVAETADPNPSETATTPEPESFDLVRISAGPPAYPRSAQRRGQTGWVDLRFTVNADGSTSDIVVVESEPGRVFDRAAIAAVEKWRYEPLETSDPTATATDRVKLEFNLSE
ncbi:MAG: TonB family protein [Pseudomonadota bacterium]